MTYEYEWDESKRLSNIRKHGVDFTLIEEFDWTRALVQDDNRFSEPRFQAFGYVHDRLHVVWYTLRGRNIRIIGIRKANAKERKIYAHNQN